MLHREKPTGGMPSEKREVPGPASLENNPPAMLHEFRTGN